MQQHLKTLNEQFKTGDTAWHCLHPSTPPENGMLAAHYVKEDHERLTRACLPPCTSFVPFFHGTYTPDWERAMPVLARSVVTLRYEDCARAWNASVRTDIGREDARHARKIAKLQKALVPEE